MHRCQHSFTNTYHTGSTSPNLEPCPEHPNCMPYLNTPAQWARFSSLGPALARRRLAQAPSFALLAQSP